MYTKCTFSTVTAMIEYPLRANTKGVGHQRIFNRSCRGSESTLVLLGTPFYFS